eukprot:TRINITY_DN246_c0_g1_i3.p1 TRINITY_DN246_c0_g1~~TRINITY_DN246_c0_g1_i3.p1  ORF type:complete len:137 (-),score=23.10 TRINITY_DN246_c0_g1_i3:493-903(-)
MGAKPSTLKEALEKRGFNCKSDDFRIAGQHQDTKTLWLNSDAGGKWRLKVFVSSVDPYRYASPEVESDLADNVTYSLNGIKVTLLFAPLDGDIWCRMEGRSEMTKLVLDKNVSVAEITGDRGSWHKVSVLLKVTFG